MGDKNHPGAGLGTFRVRMPFLRSASVLFVAMSALGPSAAHSALRSERKNEPIERYVVRSQSFVLDPEEVERNVRMGGSFAVTTGDGVVVVVVVPYDVRAPWYRAEEDTGDGIPHHVQPSDIHTYRGFVEGVPDSEVRFSIRSDALEGIILTPWEWYFVEPMRHYLPTAMASDMIAYRASYIREEALGTCGTTLAEKVFRVKDYFEPEAAAAAAGISVADVATEADYEYVTALGGSAAANDSILDIMNQVDGIYRSQLAVSLRVVYQHTWATPADPYSSTAPASMLDEFKNHWTANYASIIYDLAHMWTGKDMDGATVGIAYLGVVCNARTHAYGVSQLLNYSPAKYILTAHEIGHNFGASHPDQATPPAANCSNTIMNSSIGTGTSFCQFSKDEISAHVTQFPSCLVVEAGGNCDLTSDGQVNILDVQSLINAILGVSLCPGNCDINKDTQVNILDLQTLANVVLGVAYCP
jgi:hypothetical protein